MRGTLPRMTRFISAIGLIATFALAGCASTHHKPATKPVTRPTIVSVKKIWDKGPHNAFTDLIRFKDQWFCAFRESDAHVGGNGGIRVLTSTDGESWNAVAFVTEQGIDLRDAKLSITPQGKLMMLCGGSTYEGKKLLGMQPRVAFSEDGKTWTAPQKILAKGDWLWRVTWHNGKAYGIAYNNSAVKAADPWAVTLYSTTDGLKYDVITKLQVTDRPNESTVKFLPDGKMMAIVRREAGDQHGWLGTSSAPYTDWTWHDTGYRLGGPDLIVLPSGDIYSAGRNHVGKVHTSLFKVTPTSYEPVLDFPSGGDCSYPGLVWYDDILWMSYYSSHEGKTSIYLAKLKLN